MSDITKVYGGRATITFHKHKHYYTVTVPSLGVDRLYQPGVTSIVGKLDKSKALVPWAVRSMTAKIDELMATAPDPVDHDTVKAIVRAAESNYENIKEKSANIGSLVHRFLEAEVIARGGFGSAPIRPVADELLNPDLSVEDVGMANKAIDAGLRFLDAHHIKLIQAEAPRWSATYGYIGTGDLVAEVDGELSVLDWKTGKRLYDTVFLQLAAYQRAFEEEFPENTIAQRVGISITRDGKLSHEIRTNETLAADFRCFCGLLEAWRWDRENQGVYSKEAPAIVGPLGKK